MYAPFAPVLHYNKLQGDFVGGNFWDMRATGYRLQSPSAEQAQGPPTNPVEMGLPDSACLAYRISKARYRRIFEAVWGTDSFAIHWPANVERVCSIPAPPPANDHYPVHLNSQDRSRSNHVYDEFGLSIAAYELSPEVSPFTSKFDYVSLRRGCNQVECVPFVAAPRRGAGSWCGETHLAGSGPSRADFSRRCTIDFQTCLERQTARPRR